MKVNDQIVTSFFDTDWYKFTEFYYHWYYHREVSIRYQLMNRTKDVRTADIIPEKALREQLDAARTVRFSREQIAFLHGTNMFTRQTLEFFGYLAEYQLPEYDLRVVDGQYVPDSDSPDSIFWEIHWLETVNQLLNHFRMKMLGINESDVLREAERTLLAKIPDLKELPAHSVLEFGTRRRFSKSWQRRAYEILQNEVPSIVSATSNVEMAIETGTPWAGTHPHAGIMLEQGVAAPHGDDVLRASHNLFFTRWNNLFPYNVRVPLTDTYGHAFWTDCSRENAIACRGLRWDSGPWRDWTDRAFAFYKGHGIDPVDPVLGKDGFYSDGMWPKLMREVQAYAEHFFREVLYGWGTNESNDMGSYKAMGLSPISLVAKPVSVDGVDVGKLSANPEKSTGKPETIANLRRVYGYNPADYQAVKPIY